MGEPYFSARLAAFLSSCSWTCCVSCGKTFFYRVGGLQEVRVDVRVIAGHAGGFTAGSRGRRI